MVAPAAVAIQDDLIGREDFDAIRALMHRIAGIKLSDSKRDLVSGRLRRRLGVLGLENFSQYRLLVDSPAGDDERLQMINALTTNLTSFFREAHHFVALAELLDRMLATAEQRRLRIWSAACSSGEEPYSIAMVVHGALQKAGAMKRGWDARILATDIDSNMVDLAAAGSYQAERADAIPPQFERLVRRRLDGLVEMKQALRDLIAFKRLNLQDKWPMQGRFDVIFCRNVVIYFDKPTQRQLFDRLADLLQPDGWLFIGHSESLLGVSDRFESQGRTIYRKIR
ncbi:CheR family methyltransferase [Lichenicoccus roseus]|uniref:CheR family methyltransferase n=1 Tax=Lichenicoccus roseus TaxID=2683649 RepID=UPI00197F3B67|nr:protein-glutamate O-methyltransferase CheR [Lichenicoccus roseus]